MRLSLSPALEAWLASSRVKLVVATCDVRADCGAVHLAFWNASVHGQVGHPVMAGGWSWHFCKRVRHLSPFGRRSRHTMIGFPICMVSMRSEWQCVSGVGKRMVLSRCMIIRISACLCVCVRVHGCVRVCSVVKAHVCVSSPVFLCACVLVCMYVRACV